MAQESKPQNKRTWKPEIAGILDILGGLACVITGYYMNVGYTGDSPFVLFFVLALLALAGGIFSIGRTIWGLAMIGPVALLLGLACVVTVFILYLVAVFVRMFFGGDHLDPFYFTTLILAAIFLLGLGIPALILTIKGKQEFK
jgi:hypothetical protein